MTWRPAPSVAIGLVQGNRLWPHRDRRSDGIIGDLRHQQEHSDHNPDARGIVHAFDITHGPHWGGAEADCEMLAEHVRTRRDPRVAYIIFRRRICSSTIAPWTWRPYSGSSPHEEHLHVSIKYTSSAENDESEWWQGAEKRQTPPTLELLSAAETEDILARLDVVRKGSDDREIPGSPVHVVQAILKDVHHLYDGPVDGIFGNGTERAVRAFQEKAGLHTDGIVGHDTRYALNA